MNYKNLPLVVFFYPDSITNIMKERLVRVTKADSTYIEGFEVIAAHQDNHGKFKKFSLTRIDARVGATLLSFTPPKAD